MLKKLFLVFSTLFFVSVVYGQTSTVKSLIDQQDFERLESYIHKSGLNHYPINVSEYENYSLLGYAIKAEKEEVIDYLLKIDSIDV